MADPKRRYWDSSAFIANITNRPANHEQITEDIIQSAASGDCLIITSAITLAEVIRPGRKSQIQMDRSKEEQIRAFFNNPWIRLVDFVAPLGALARQLQWDHGLHVRDAVHLASALHAKVDVIEAYDPDFLRIDRSRIDGCPVIRMPSIEQPSLAPVTPPDSSAAASPSAPGDEPNGPSQPS